jgi:hypothetical protein
MQNAENNNQPAAGNIAEMNQPA